MTKNTLSGLLIALVALVAFFSSKAIEANPSELLAHANLTIVRRPRSLPLLSSMPEEKPLAGRGRRDVKYSFSIARTCELTPDELAGLVSVLRTANDQLNGKNLRTGAGASHCAASPPSSNLMQTDCQRQVNEIKAAVELITCEAELMGKSAMTDKGQLEGLRRDIEAQRANFNKLEASLKAQHEQTLKKEIGKFTNSLNNLQRQLTAAIQKVVKLENEKSEKTIGLVIAHIGLDNPLQAVQQFNELNRTNLEILKRIIRSAYHDGKSASKVVHIVKFLGELTYLDQRVRGSVTLYELLEGKADWSSAGILRYSWICNSTLVACDFKNLDGNLKQQARNLATTLHTKAKQLVANWGSRVARGDYAMALGSMETTTYHAFLRPHITTLMQSAYNSRNHVDVLDKILPLLQTVGYWNPQLDCTEQLLSLLKSNGGIYKQKAFEFIDMIEKLRIKRSNLSPPLLAQLTRIVDSVPSNMAFFMGKRCAIKNTYWGEYLEGLEDWKFNSERRHVVTSSRKYFEWTFEPQDNGKYFYIKNWAYEEYLYAANDAHAWNRDRRRVFTWVPGGPVTQGKWIIEPHNNGAYFEIKSEAHYDYLYASSFTYPTYDVQVRQVFDWINRDRFLSSRWVFECIPTMPTWIPLIFAVKL